jgi:hypothetical protein
MAAGGQNKIPAADQLFVFVTAATETGEMRAPLLVAKSWPVARLADLVRRELGLAPGERVSITQFIIF